MAKDDVIDFAQAVFGTDSGVPADATVRPPVPGWLAAADAVPIEDEEITIRTEGEVIRGEPSQSETSPDDLAYYLPFHFYTERWGIYVRASGVWTLAAALTPAPSINHLKFAHEALLLHERFHFLAEYAASRLEVVTAESRYREYFGVKKAALLEEATANAHAISGLPRHHLRRLAALQAWMLKQPPGYCDFKHCLPPKFSEALRDLAVQFFVAPTKNRKLRAVPGLNALSHRTHPAEFLFAGIDSRLSPSFIIPDATVPWLRVAKPFPKQFGLQIHVFPNDHEPLHIHIDCPPGRAYTRYLWPDLRPYPGDMRLRRADEKSLRRYIGVYGNAIAQKIKAMPWHAGGAG